MDPSDFRPRLCSYPAAITTNPVFGLGTLHWPEPLYPHATVEPSQILFETGGDRASANVRCTLRFQNTTESRRDEQPCDFLARLTRQGPAWVIESIQK